MLNSFVVMKKPIGISGLLSNLGHHPFRTSEVLSSPTVVLKRDSGERDIILCAYSRQHGECRCPVREDDVAVYLTCEMPEVDKKDVKITVENNKLIVIKGERQDNNNDDDDDDEKNLKYCCTFKLKLACLKINEVKAEMKDGLVEVVLPKMKAEERNDIIHHVKVD